MPSILVCLQLGVRIDPTGSRKRWRLSMVEVWDASCTSPYPTGFLHTTNGGWVDAGAPAAAAATDGSAPPPAAATDDSTKVVGAITLNGCSVQRYDTCEVVLAPGSGPFNGSLWLTISDEAQQVCNVPCWLDHIQGTKS
jgi:hypothetical protein